MYCLTNVKAHGQKQLQKTDDSYNVDYTCNMRGGHAVSYSKTRGQKDANDISALVLLMITSLQIVLSMCHKLTLAPNYLLDY